MKNDIKKALCIVLSVLITLTIVPFVFADNTPVIYAQLDKDNNKVILSFESKQEITKAEYKFTASSGVTITSSQGLSVGDSDVVTIMSSESTYAEGTTRYFGTSTPITGKINVGSFNYSTSLDLKNKNFDDLFTLSDTKINGAVAEIELKIVNGSGEELSELTSEAYSEAKSETESEPFSEPISEPLSEIESESVSEFVSESESEPISESESESQNEPEIKTYNPDADIYVYEDFKGDFFAVLSVNTDGADSVSFDIKPLKSAFTLGAPEIIGSNDITAEKDGNVISVNVKNGYNDGFVKIPLSFASKTFAYAYRDSLFTLDYCFVNGAKKNISLNTEVPAFNPVDKSSYFKGFDATFNTYEEDGKTYYSYKLYAVSVGFVTDFELSVDINDKYSLIKVETEDNFISETVSNTVTVKSEENTATKLEYTPVATIYFTYTGDSVAYEDFWNNANIKKITANGIDYTECDMTLKALLGYGYHFDTVDGVIYASIDYKNEPRYTAVYGYDSEQLGENITVPETVRNGYIVAAVESKALRGSKIKSIILPNSIEKIGENAFENCIELETISIPKTVYSIGNEAFKNCSSLKTVNFESGSKLEKIGNDTFVGCTSYLDIILPDGSYTIGNHAFGFTVSNNKYSVIENARILYKTSKSPAIAYSDEYGVAYLCVDEKDLTAVKGAKTTVYFNDTEKYILILTPSTYENILDIAQSKNFEIKNGNEVIENNEKLKTGMTAVINSEAYNVVLKADTDGNGKITVADARTVLRHIAKLKTVSGAFEIAADVDNSGKVNTADARRILRVVAKLDKFE